jgi:hypothetical protein
VDSGSGLRPWVYSCVELVGLMLNYPSAIRWHVLVGGGPKVDSLVTSPGHEVVFLAVLQSSL